MKVKVIYGDNEKEFEIYEGEKLWRLIEKAISTKGFNLPPPEVNYQLFYSRKLARLLDPHKSLKENNVPEGGILVMAHVHMVGD